MNNLTAVSKNNSTLMHLFEHPICDQQTLIRKVANVFFHIVTLCIPLIIYKVVSCFMPKKPSDINLENCICCLKVPVLNSVQSEKLRSDTLAFARQKLAERQDIQPLLYECDSLDETIQPMNQEIGKLIALSNEFNWRLIGNDVAGENPYEQRPIQEIIDTQMKIRYATSVLALEELPAFTQQHRVTTANALINSHSHLTLNFFHFSKFYHRIRGEAQLTADHLFYQDRPVSPDHEKTFYQPKSMQNQWRLLYNDYCNRVHSNISDAKLRKATLDHHADWTQKDLGPQTFQRVPGLLPGCETW